MAAFCSIEFAFGHVKTRSNSLRLYLTSPSKAQRYFQPPFEGISLILIPPNFVHLRYHMSYI